MRDIFTFVRSALFRPKQGYIHTRTFIYLSFKVKAGALDVTIKVGMEGKIELFFKVHFSKLIWGNSRPWLSQSASEPPVNS